MKAFYSISHFLTVAILLVPTVALAGPDDSPRVRRDSVSHSTRLAPPGVTVQTTTTITEGEEEEERPIQPLRQREESVHYRIAYKLLNNLGFTGTEGDQKPVGYQQIYGPPPMLVYRRPPAPRPRRFPHFAAPEDKAEGTAAPVTAKPAPIAPPAPDALPVPAVPSSASAKPTPDDADQAGILPDAEQQAAKNRNEEMLSYFRRPSGPNTTQNNGPGPGSGPMPQDIGVPGYLQAPEQLPIPPSRATYRVVPK